MINRYPISDSLISAALQRLNERRDAIEKQATAAVIPSFWVALGAFLVPLGFAAGIVTFPLGLALVAVGFGVGGASATFSIVNMVIATNHIGDREIIPMEDRTNGFVVTEGYSGNMNFADAYQQLRTKIIDDEVSYEQIKTMITVVETAGLEPTGPYQCPSFEIAKKMISEGKTELESNIQPGPQDERVNFYYPVHNQSFFHEGSIQCVDATVSSNFVMDVQTVVPISERMSNPDLLLKSQCRWHQTLEGCTDSINVAFTTEVENKNWRCFQPKSQTFLRSDDPK